MTENSNGSGIIPGNTFRGCRNSTEYLDDILQYRDKKFQFPKTPKVYPLIVELLTYAVENGKAVMIDFN